MIIRIGPRDSSADEPLAEALGRPVSDGEGLTDHTVVAHWPNLDLYTPVDEGQTWTSAEFAEHLDDPNWRYPAPVSPHGDRRAIWHAAVVLHPDDRDLTGPEWSEIAHLISPRTRPDPQQAVQQARFAGRTRQADATSQLAGLLRQLADERTGPLSTVRGLIEHAAHRLDGLPDAYGPDSAHQLELIARRLYGIQQSLESMAAALPAAARPAPV